MNGSGLDEHLGRPSGNAGGAGVSHGKFQIRIVREPNSRGLLLTGLVGIGGAFLSRLHRTKIFRN